MSLLGLGDLAKVAALKMAMDNHFGTCSACKPIVAEWISKLGTPEDTGAQPELCEIGVSLRKDHTKALMALPFPVMSAYVQTMIILDDL
jgi:hypothetical protein